MVFFVFFGKEPRNIFRFSEDEYALQGSDGRYTICISVKNSLDLAIEKSCELKKLKTLEILNLVFGYMFG